MKLLRMSFFAALLPFMTTVPLEAQPRRGGVFVRVRPRVHVVHAAPRVVVNVRATTRLADRRAVALAYLNDHDHLTVRRYARMTGLSRAQAEAELDGFAADPLCPLVRKSTGRKKMYVKSALTAQSTVCPLTTAN